ncbi:hypothetical protein [Tuwongella immobilis]|uniref:Uncharacterized protein n=1 Tax=Tuwongella immobilis TaxID=692036 RepID=A0A6C2YIV6_9BACT|nr:hypothetical protein [Tuwongella immobilis]VIP01470.1 unnamed protein product [Tuwongella immobilis]VTR98502.1 unnamed protein product [Tuwongella immobilis]
MEIKLLVGIIFLVIWVVSNLIRNQQEETKPQPTRRPPVPPTGGGRGPKPQTKDIEAFLKEIDRVRRGGKPETTATVPPPAAPAPVKPTPRANPASAPAAQPKSRQSTSGNSAGSKTRSEDTDPAKPKPKPKPKPVEPPSVRPVSMAELEDLPPPPVPAVRTVEERFNDRMASGEATLAGTSAAAMPPSPITASTPGSGTPQSTALRSGVAIEGSVAAMIKTLLQSRQSVPAAVVLQEILGEPRCRKSIRPQG